MPRRICYFSFILALAFILNYSPSVVALASDDPPGQPPPAFSLPNSDLDAKTIPDEITDPAVVLYTTIGELDVEPLPVGLNIQVYFYTGITREFVYEAEDAFSGSQYTFSLVLASASSTTFSVELAVNDLVVASTEITAESDTYSRFDAVIEGDQIDVAVGDTVALNVTHTSGGNAGLLSAAPPNGSFIEISNAVQTMPELNISASAPDSNEGDGVVNLTVALNHESDNPVSVDLEITEGNAVVDQDFILETDSVTFSPGETTKSVTINIVDDQLDEPEESFTVTLSNPSNAELGENTAASIRIIDNDEPPTLEFSTSTLSIREDQGAVMLSIVADTPSGRTMQVICDVIGGDATPGADFEMERQTVELAPGQLEGQATLKILNDDISEDATEYVLITLSNPTNSQLNSESTITVEIIDDDGDANSGSVYLPIITKQ